jgi:alpha/beta hydrolase fold
MQTRASTPTDRAVAGDGVRLHARDWGGDGPAVLVLHGLASNARIWDGVGPRLVGAGLRVVALDLRGHGASDQPGSGYDFASVGRDLAAALGGLGLERPLLAGRFDPGGSGGQPWVRDYLRAGVEVDDRGVASSRFRFDNHMQVVDALYDQRPATLYPLVDCPVLLCVADDPADDGEHAVAKRDAVGRALQLLPSAHGTWYEDTMHDIPLQRPAELAADLARFAKEVSGRG